MTRLFLFILMVLLVAPPSAPANQIGQYPVEIVGLYAALHVYLVNDDNGAIYDSYDLYLFRSLGDQLLALPHNQTAYPNVEALIADWNITIMEDEVQSKWSVDISDNNPMLISHTGLGYARWYATQQDPSRDTMALRFSIPVSQLDGNGNGYSTDDPVDWRVVLTTNVVPGAGVGHSVDAFDYSAPGLGYGVERWGEEVTSVQCSVTSGEITITNTLAGYIHDLECAAPSAPSTWIPLTTSVATGPIHTLAVPMTNDAQWFRVWSR